MGRYAVCASYEEEDTCTHEHTSVWVGMPSVRVIWSEEEDTYMSHWLWVGMPSVRVIWSLSPKKKMVFLLCLR
jgi:hypothetical protein